MVCERPHFYALVRLLAWCFKDAFTKTGIVASFKKRLALPSQPLDRVGKQCYFRSYDYFTFFSFLHSLPYITIANSRKMQELFKLLEIIVVDLNENEKLCTVNLRMSAFGVDRSLTCPSNRHGKVISVIKLKKIHHVKGGKNGYMSVADRI